MKDLKNAKIGDKLIINSRWSESLGEIAGFTKAGNIKTVSGQIFYPDGSERGGRSEWYTDHAYVATAEDVSALKVKLRTSKLASRLAGTHVMIWQKLELEDLEVINKILDTLIK